MWRPQAAVHPPPLSYRERRLLFKKCRSYLVGDDYPMGWFQSSNLKSENVVLWILWALFSTETCKPEWEEEINEYLLDIESSRKLDGSYNGAAKR